jgi:hypothetical protein
MEVVRTSETSIHIWTTRCNIPIIYLVPALILDSPVTEIVLPSNSHATEMCCVEWRLYIVLSDAVSVLVLTIL